MRNLGEVHHPNPYDSGDDVFEARNAIYELDVEGGLIEDTVYYLEQYGLSGWRVGDLNIDDEGGNSHLEQELTQRFESIALSNASNGFGDTRTWQQLTQSSATATKSLSIKANIELKPNLDNSNDFPTIAGKLRKEIIARNPKLQNQQYPYKISNIEAFELRSGVMIAFIQIMHYGGRYDLGVLSARSDDQQSQLMVDLTGSLWHFPNH
jgi:hypothetical protein